VKILYISQYFPPEMGAPAARASELSRYWAREGHDVTVLTGFPNHPTGVVPREYRDKMRRLLLCEKYDSVKVVRTWLLPFPNRKAHERILNYSSFCISSGTAGLRLPRPDVVIASSPQLLVGLSGWWLARCKGSRSVFEVRDLWPESLAAVGMGNRESFLHRSLARIAGFLYRASDHIVVVSPAFKRYLTERWNVAPDKISVVENGVETNVFYPRDESALLRKKLELERKFVVSYIGTIGMAHRLETVIEAAGLLQNSSPEVCFLIVGEGAEKAHIQSLAASRKLSNVIFVNQQPRESIPGYISASDACLVLLKKSELFKTVIPSKMLEFMSCARPVILGVEGQAKHILEQAEAGICFTPENAAELAKVVTDLAQRPALRESLGRNGRNYIVQYFSRYRTAQHYLGVLEHVLKDGIAQSTAA
jgi:glycosyltransferase involved in cell wall biosynthesis